MTRAFSKFIRLVGPSPSTRRLPLVRLPVETISVYVVRNSWAHQLVQAKACTHLTADFCARTIGQRLDLHHAVLGESGLLSVGDRLITVEKDGEVMLTEKDDTDLQEQDFLDRLRIVIFRSGDDSIREEAGLYRAREGRREDTHIDRPIVHAGQLEGSAVSPVPELVRMIEAMRSYEAAASALKATDRTLGRAVNDIARI